MSLAHRHLPTKFHLPMSCLHDSDITQKIDSLLEQLVHPTKIVSTTDELSSPSRLQLSIPLPSKRSTHHVPPIAAHETAIPTGDISIGAI